MPGVKAGTPRRDKRRKEVNGLPAKKCGYPEHQPTERQRTDVEKMAGVGVPHHQIAAIIWIDTKTLLKHYPVQLEVGKAKATASIAGKLYTKAMGGDTASVIFWLKAQAGWSERQVVEHQGGITVLTGVPQPDNGRD